MKLSPPASSSDLETAREIARRLHQHRRREDLPGADLRAPVPVSTPARPALPPPVPRPPTAAPPVERPAPTPAVSAAPAAPPPEPAPWDLPAAPPEPDPLAAMVEPPVAEMEVAPPDVPLPDFEDEGVSPEEMVGVEEPAPLDDLPAPEPFEAPPSPFDVELDESEDGAGEVFEAPPPSWDQIVETCLSLSQSQGGMIVDPAGQVFAARGSWPGPGPEAIAAKLVATMERTLKDAPTRSISAPLMGRHLTAWRVPLSEGLVTVAFLGEAPVRAEIRPAIDGEILRGAGA